MPFSDPPGESITIPDTATEDDPRIVIGTDDPLSDTINDAAISMYWDRLRGYVLGVERSGEGVNSIGQWRLYSRIDGVLAGFLSVDSCADDYAGSPELMTGVVVNGGWRYTPSSGRGQLAVNDNGRARLQGHDVRIAGDAGAALTVEIPASLTAPSTVGGRPIVGGTGAGLTHWQQLTVTTNASGIATVTHAAGFTPTAVLLTQNGVSGSVGLNLIFITGSATGTTFQVKAMNGGAAFVGSVGVTALMCA